MMIDDELESPLFFGVCRLVTTVVLIVLYLFCDVTVSLHGYFRGYIELLFGLITPRLSHHRARRNGGSELQGDRMHTFEM